MALTGLRYLLALTYLMAAVGKLTSAEEAVALFSGLPVGAWFRYAVGMVELVGVALLLTSRVAAAALLLGPLMAGAIIAHLGGVPGEPLVPAVLLGLLATLAWHDASPTRGSLRLRGGEQPAKAGP